MAGRRTVLITGASGRIGQVIVPLMMAEGRYELRCTHLSAQGDPPGLPNPMFMDLGDPAGVRAAVEGVDTVLHLAASSGDRPFIEQLVPDNIIGPYNLCEAALAAGCRRVLFASTNHVVLNYCIEGMSIDESVEPRPDSIYGVTKAYGEILGRFYVEKRGLRSFISLRIGWFMNENSPHLRRSWQALHMWISARDFVDLTNRCIEAPDGIGYRCYHAVSDNDRGLFKLDRAKRELGYSPRDNSERFVPEFTGELPPWLVRRREPLS